MTKLKKCQKCGEYNLKDACRKCESKTEDAHYKFIKTISVDSTHL